MARCAFSGLLRPWHIFKYAAQPSPKHQANACAMIKIGNTTPVAAFPKVPNSLFPIKIWSTILYSELINKDKIHGIENFNINLLMRPFPKSSVSLVVIINPFLRNRASNSTPHYSTPTRLCQTKSTRMGAFFISLSIFTEQSRRQAAVYTHQIIP